MPNNPHSYASELHPNPDPNALRVCEGCGCTDRDACLDPATGEACYWVQGIFGDLGGNLCSACGRIALATPLVEVFSDHEADLEIRERRKAAGR